MKISKSFQYGGRKITLQTGHLAKQADGAVLVSMGNTVILVTAVREEKTGEAHDFIALTVNYQERYYANGRFPGGFIKRETRPSVQETLISRLIDRSLRPLFPEGFTDEVQIVATLLSYDTEVSADIPAIIGAAAALEISGIPFHGPLAGARVGYYQDKYILNPSSKELSNSKLDLVVAGTETAILMVESSAQELSEDEVLAGIMFGHRHMQAAIQAIKALAIEAGKPKQIIDKKEEEKPWKSTLEKQATSQLEIILNNTNRNERNQQLANFTKQIKETLSLEHPNLDLNELETFLQHLERKIVREKILNGLPRLDGRDQVTVRPITIDLGILPRAHGSVVFTRGETQALVTTTLGIDSNAQTIDTVSGESNERFMLHYNFLPFCTGEVGMLGSPKRRELGHGALAKRALQAVLPSKEEFPYVIRIVSEIIESNGSSSMATVCGGCLALMEAGVPIKAPVAGIAMGLVKEQDRFAILTDILGDEDHLGDMDFKVAGTLDGITALQMDIKTEGITEEIIRIALAQAKEGRMHIFSKMQECIAAPRETLADNAPQITTFTINPEKIKDVIGKGGSVIRNLVETTGANIDISDNGTITIATSDSNAARVARQKIEAIVTEVEVGKTYDGIVSKILDFGAVVNILPNKDGLVHISQICKERIKSVGDHLHEGDNVRVKVIEIDERGGKIRLSIKQAQEEVIDPSSEIEE